MNSRPTFAGGLLRLLVIGVFVFPFWVISAILLAFLGYYTIPYVLPRALVLLIILGLIRLVLHIPYLQDRIGGFVSKWIDRPALKAKDGLLDFLYGVFRLAVLCPIDFFFFQNGAISRKSRAEFFQPSWVPIERGESSPTHDKEMYGSWGYASWEYGSWEYGSWEAGVKRMNRDIYR